MVFMVWLGNSQWHYSLNTTTYDQRKKCLSASNFKRGGTSKPIKGNSWKKNLPSNNYANQ